MIGNDVVDLTDPEVQSGATHRRFDDRVFAASEREALRSSREPDRMRWILWAAKEAAYKVARKLDRRVVWSPPHFVVSLDGTLCGAVRYEGRGFPVRVRTQLSGIHAIAASDPASADRARSRVVSLTGPTTGGRASRCVRELAIGALARWLREDPGDLAIVRDARIPRLELRGKRAPVDLSLSHHGRLVAYACAPDLRPGAAQAGGVSA